jgi:hypothetical protein
MRVVSDAGSHGRLLAAQEARWLKTRSAALASVRSGPMQGGPVDDGEALRSNAVVGELTLVKVDSLAVDSLAVHSQDTVWVRLLLEYCSMNGLLRLVANLGNGLVGMGAFVLLMSGPVSFRLPCCAMRLTLSVRVPSRVTCMLSTPLLEVRRTRPRLHAIVPMPHAAVLSQLLT